MYKKKVFEVLSFFELIMCAMPPSSAVEVKLACSDPPPFPSKPPDDPDVRMRGLDKLQFHFFTTSTGIDVGDTATAHCVEGLVLQYVPSRTYDSLECGADGWWHPSGWENGPCVFMDLQNLIPELSLPHIVTTTLAQTQRHGDPWVLYDLKTIYDVLLVDMKFPISIMNNVIMRNFEIGTLMVRYTGRYDAVDRCAFYREVLPTTNDSSMQYTPVLCCLGECQARYVVIRLIDFMEVLKVINFTVRGFKCPAGRTGDWCETALDMCTDDSCSNGRICTPGIEGVDPPGRIICRCADGYTGQNCLHAEDINQCDSAPCQHGATCQDGVNRYSCICVLGYEGKDCEDAKIDIDPCTSSPCLNGASCYRLWLSTPDIYSCQPCLPGFTGLRCETRIPEEEDECSASPCQNGATCINYMNFLSDDYYTCKCSLGYFGDNCERTHGSLKDECDSRPCQNQGTCSKHVDSYTCQCRAGYRGLHCEAESENIDRGLVSGSGPAVESVVDTSGDRGSPGEGWSGRVLMDNKPALYGGTAAAAMLVVMVVVVVVVKRRRTQMADKNSLVVEEEVDAHIGKDISDFEHVEKSRSRVTIARIASSSPQSNYVISSSVSCSSSSVSTTFSDVNHADT